MLIIYVEVSIRITGKGEQMEQFKIEGLNASDCHAFAN